MGNLQVRFLEGWAPAMAPGHSTTCPVLCVYQDSADYSDNLRRCFTTPRTSRAAPRETASNNSARSRLILVGFYSANGYLGGSIQIRPFAEDAMSQITFPLRIAKTGHLRRALLSAATLLVTLLSALSALAQKSGALVGVVEAPAAGLRNSKRCGLLRMPVASCRF
jgi:hypothetical protein